MKRGIQKQIKSKKVLEHKKVSKQILQANPKEVVVQGNFIKPTQGQSYQLKVKVKVNPTNPKFNFQKLQNQKLCI